jgi:membrane fusion protein, heavy metal efflux system
MRARMVWALLSGMLLLAGCADEEAHDEHAEESMEGHDEHDVSGAGAGIVAIDPEMRRDLRITTAKAESRMGGEGASMLGEVKVNEDAYAELSSPLAARVVRIFASPGEHVEVGQPLVELESVELGKSRAEYVSAKARAGLARQALERKRGLVEERIAAKRELQEAEAEAAAAQSELRAARTTLVALGISDAEVDRDRSVDARFTLRSPIAGTVLERSVVQGQSTEAGRTLFRVSDLVKLWLSVRAFERDAVRVNVGTTARVTFPALPGRTFSGTVTLIGGQVDTASRTIQIRIELLNESGALRPGMSATAWLPLGDAGNTVIAVPAASLQRTQEGWCVFLPREDGTFEMRMVGRGRDLGGEIEIVSGLAPDETVVVDGAFLLKAEAEKERGEGAHHDH